MKLSAGLDSFLMTLAIFIWFAMIIGVVALDSWLFKNEYSVVGISVGAIAVAIQIFLIVWGVLYYHVRTKS